jgi:hypothetical protein
MLLPRALILLSVGALSCRPHESAGEPRRARVAVLAGLSGAVDVLHAGSVDWARIATGAALFEDDRLRTFRGAWAHLLFDGGSTLRVEEESLISLGGGITVERGTVAGELQAGLRLKTPAAEAESTAKRDIVIQ